MSIKYILALVIGLCLGLGLAGTGRTVEAQSKKCFDVNITVAKKNGWGDVFETQTTSGTICEK